MVLCAVADLMFSSKLRAAASHLGVTLRFVRSPDALLRDAREFEPTLVIIDLNADVVAPLEMIARLRADPELAGTRTVGFASHVDATRMAAARAAGLDEIMPRSAFVTRLPELLQPR